MKLKMDINRWRSAADITVLECEPMYASSMYVHKLIVEANLYSNESLLVTFTVGGQRVAVDVPLVRSKTVDEEYALYEALIPTKLFKTAQTVNINIGLFTLNSAGNLSQILSTTPTPFVIEGDGTLFENQMTDEERSAVNEALIEITSMANDAVAAADNAVVKADSAINKANEAVLTSNDANAKATNAVSTSKKAETTADGAVTKAQEAITKANNAVTKSAAADTKADKSVAQSEEALSKADSAVAQSNAAVVISNAANEIARKTQNKIETFSVGNVTARTVDEDEPASVEAEVETTENDELRLNMDFGLPKGKTPNIRINATVDETDGNPNVEVETEGTLENPIFNLKFTGLKGKTEGAVTGLRGQEESEYKTGNVIITPEKIGAVARNKGFNAKNLDVGTYAKIFESGICSEPWDTITLVFMISDKNAINDAVASAGYRVTYRMLNTSAPTMVIERLFGAAEADKRLYINYKDTSYTANSNKFEIYWKVGYKGEETKLVEVLSYSRRNGDDLNEYVLYTGEISGTTSPTTLGAFGAFADSVITTMDLTAPVSITNRTWDLSSAPPSAVYAGLNIYDKNKDWVNYFRGYNGTGKVASQMGVRSKRTGTDSSKFVELAFDDDDTIAKFRASSNNTIDLGSSGYKWRDAYATTFHGNLDGTAQSFTRHTLIAADDLNDIVNEGYYKWDAMENMPSNAPPGAQFSVMIVMYCSSNNYSKQLVFRQGSKSNSNGQYTSDEIWMRSRVTANGVHSWTEWVLIPTERYLNAHYVSKDTAVSRADYFNLGTVDIGQYGKVFTSGKLHSSWDSISMIFIVSDKNAINTPVHMAGYWLTYKGHGTSNATMEIKRLFGADAASEHLYINYVVAPYAEGANCFEIFWQSGYKGDESKGFQVLSYNHRSGTDINDFTQNVGIVSGIAEITSLGTVAKFSEIETVTYLPSSGGTVTGQLVLSNRNDASGTANTSPPLIVGGLPTQTHLEFDNNEIMAKSDEKTPAKLVINNEGGEVEIGSDGLIVRGAIRPNSNNTRDLGTSSLSFKDAYIETVHGTLDGNASSATKFATVRSIDGVSFDGTANIVHFGICKTDANTNAKTVTIEGFNKVEGAIVQVMFTFSNRLSEDLTLNVNNTGAYKIKRSTTTCYPCYAEGTTMTLIFRGTYWQIISRSDLNQNVFSLYSTTSVTTGTKALLSSISYLDVRYLLVRARKKTSKEYIHTLIPANATNFFAFESIVLQAEGDFIRFNIGNNKGSLLNINSINNIDYFDIFAVY